MSALAIAEGELLREAARILRKLAQSEAKLVPANGAYALTNGDKKRPTVSAAMVAAFRRRDWIVEDDAAPGCFVLSDAGLGWVRRQLAAADPFAAQHRIERVREIMSDEGAARVTVNDGESPLGWLRRRRGPDGRPLIDETQFAAGERLRCDFTIAQMSPRMAADLSAPVIAGRRGAKLGSPLSDSVLDAKQRLTRALTAVGPGLSDLLLDVCCHLIGLEAAERQKGWPQRSAKVVLVIALDRLAAHYGTGTITGTGSRLRAWASEEAEKETARES